MKKIILIIFFNLLFLSCFSQDSLKKKYQRFGVGFYTGASLQYVFSRVPYIFYTLPRHKVALGMVIGYRPVNVIDIEWGDYYDAYMTTEDKIHIIGASAVYQFIPNHPAKIFDLYFDYRLTWILMRTKILYIDSEAYYHSFENLVSYGMKIKFLKHCSFYLGQGFGVISNIGRYSHYKTIPLYGKSKFTIGLNAGLDFHL